MYNFQLLMNKMKEIVLVNAVTLKPEKIESNDDDSPFMFLINVNYQGIQYDKIILPKSSILFMGRRKDE